MAHGDGSGWGDVADDLVLSQLSQEEKESEEADFLRDESASEHSESESSDFCVTAPVWWAAEIKKATPAFSEQVVRSRVPITIVSACSGALPEAAVMEVSWQHCLWSASSVESRMRPSPCNNVKQAQAVLLLASTGVAQRCSACQEPKPKPKPKQAAGHQHI